MEDAAAILMGAKPNKKCRFLHNKRLKRKKTQDEGGFKIF
jgi:hypothetical protein